MLLQRLTLVQGLVLLLLLSLVWLGLQELGGWRPTAASNNTRILRLATWGSQAEVETLTKLCHAFEADYQHHHPQAPALRVEIRHTPDNYASKQHLYFSIQQSADVVMLNNGMIPTFAKAGVLAPVPATVAKQLEQTDYPSVLQALRTSQTSPLWAYPRDASAVAVFVNTSLLKQLHAPLPPTDWTWPQALAWSLHVQQKLTASPTPPKWVWSFYQQPYLFLQPFVALHQGEALTAPFSLATQQGLALLHDVRWKHHLSPRPTEIGTTPMSELFLKQRLVCLVSGRWSEPQLRTHASFAWQVRPFPVDTQGQQPTRIDATGYAVWAKTPHPNEAHALAAFLTSPRSQAVWANSGVMIPAHQGVAQQAHPPIASAFLSTVEQGKASPSLANGLQRQRCLTEFLDGYWLNQTPLAPALKQLKEHCPAW